MAGEERPAHATEGHKTADDSHDIKSEEPDSSLSSTSNVEQNVNHDGKSKVAVDIVEPKPSKTSTHENGDTANASATKPTKLRDVKQPQPVAVKILQSQCAMLVQILKAQCSEHVLIQARTKEKSTVLNRLPSESERELRVILSRMKDDEVERHLVTLFKNIGNYISENYTPAAADLMSGYLQRRMHSLIVYYHHKLHPSAEYYLRIVRSCKMTLKDNLGAASTWSLDESPLEHTLLPWTTTELVAYGMALASLPDWDSIFSIFKHRRQSSVYEKRHVLAPTCPHFHVPFGADRPEIEQLITLLKIKARPRGGDKEWHRKMRAHGRKQGGYELPNDGLDDEEDFLFDIKPNRDELDSKLKELEEFEDEAIEMEMDEAEEELEKIGKGVPEDSRSSKRQRIGEKRKRD